jgi:hypothetical protein
MIMILIIIELLIYKVGRAETATKLQVLLPGMTAAPGTDKGYTGQPNSQSTGSPFNVTIHAVDDNWNIVSLSDQISISSSDPSASLPLPFYLENGTATVSITFNSEGTQAISAHDISNPSVTGITSPSITVLSLSHFTISDIGRPWWVYPGQVYVADEIDNVEIIARDSYGNRAYAYNGEVNLSEYTDDGIGRIVPSSVTLTDGRWK